MRILNFPWFLLFELVLLFVAMPLLYVIDGLLPVHKVIPLIVLLGYCTIILLIKKPVNVKRFSLTANWKWILIRFMVVGLVVLAYIKFAVRVDLFADLQHNRKLFYMILMYPLLSVLPQEVIFREFFFYRYETIFRNRVVLIVANVLLFAFAHIYFQNWMVLIFTIIGGGIFACTYSQTRSLLVVSIEHTLYGLMILSSGLGEQFYKAF